MTVMVKLNGKGPYKLIFDTGAPTLLINNKIAKDADLLKDAEKPLIAPFGSKGEVKVKTLEVGEQKAENVPAMIMDHPTVEAISDAFKKDSGEIDGIVGFPFFARFKMTLDYRAKTMTFVPNGYNPPNVTEAMQKELMERLTKGDTVKILAPASQWGMICEKGEKDKDDGVVVKDVLPDSATAKAGLKKGDRVLTIDGRWTDSLADLYTAAGYVKPGKTVAVVIQRDGKEKELQVTPRSGF
jgi:membrane-associated protease RseP (regulator of RpoE activity)